MTQEDRIDRWERIVNMAENYLMGVDLTEEDSPEDDVTATADVAWARNLVDIARAQLPGPKS